jgi:DNA-binding MarR family transcriptional regulator
MKKPENIEDFLAFRLFNLSKLAVRGLGIMLRRELNISKRDWRILAYVGQRPDMSLTELSAVAELDPVVTSRGVDKLVARGVILKKRLASNKRLLVLSLSSTGQAFYERALNGSKLYNMDFAACLSQEEAVVLDALLSKLGLRAAELIEQESAKGGSLEPDHADPETLTSD